METISNMATVARNSVFGEGAATAQSGTEPPAGGAPGKGTADAPYDPGNVPEQVPTQSGTEPPSGGPTGKSTADAPFDRGNEPEQVQVTGSSADAAGATEPPPSSVNSTNKADAPDSSAASNANPAIPSHDAAETAKPVVNDTSSETQPKAKKGGAAKSHSALFGLCREEEEGGGGIHPPKDSGEVSGTFDEAAGVMNEQAEMDKRGAADEDDTGGYIGLKKAAMEEEEKRRKRDAEGQTGTTATSTLDDERVPSTSASRVHCTSLFLLTALLFTGTMEKKNSLGREISPGEMPDGTHRKSIIAEDMPEGHHFGRKSTWHSGDKTGGFRDRLKDKFRSRK